MRLKHPTFIGLFLVISAAASTAVWAAEDYRFEDGTRIAVHALSAEIAGDRRSNDFSRDVLDAAVNAYLTITEFKGFHSRGYSFASPDKNYAFDPDGAIDIYIGSASDDGALAKAGLGHMSFRDAPCFDTVKRGAASFDAVILLPSHYAQFIRGWEKINPSPLGKRNLEVDLHGTLMHEMLHVLLFYYNKNLRADDARSAKNADWYVEGLARYFETFAGARHDFFSLGFKERLPDKIRFSRGGINYFMRYPDQAFTQLRYENALFWRYLDERFGMNAIERLSRELRNPGAAGFKSALEKATGVGFDELLLDLSDRLLTKELGLKDDAAFLNDIARTRLALTPEGAWLLDGDDRRAFLGKTCATDWVGRWQDSRSRLGEAPAAGDPTERADVSGWATDYFEIAVPEPLARLPRLAVRPVSSPASLSSRAYLVTRGGSWIRQTLPADLSETARRQGLADTDIERIFVLTTNLDPERTADYNLQFS